MTTLCRTATSPGRRTLFYKILQVTVGVQVVLTVYCILYNSLDMKGVFTIAKLSLYQQLMSSLNEASKRELLEGLQTANLKKILYWNDFFGDRDFHFGQGQQPFIDKCEVNICFATHYRDLFPPEEYDAVIWHAKSSDLSLPKVKVAKTRYVFIMGEPPTNINFNLDRYNQVFNYTMTYRRDSDVHAPYGRFVPLSTPLRRLSDPVDYSRTKTKMAAWFVSHCTTSSRREELVTALQQHVQVDVYGRCGSLSCDRRQSSWCLDMLSRDYFFYLSFENSLCRDYVTEKFFRIAQYDVVPVVYGEAEYSAIAPAQSYINALDFRSVKELAEYLVYLTNNSTAYNEYFKWKQRYKVQENMDNPLCELCRKLHEDQDTKTYDIEEWYSAGKCVDVTNNKYVDLFS